jgi:hypothetical protein
MDCKIAAHQITTPQKMLLKYHLQNILQIALVNRLASTHKTLAVISLKIIGKNENKTALNYLPRC